MKKYPPDTHPYERPPFEPRTDSDWFFSLFDHAVYSWALICLTVWLIWANPGNWQDVLLWVFGLN